MFDNIKKKLGMNKSVGDHDLEWTKVSTPSGTADGVPVKHTKEAWQCVHCKKSYEDASKFREVPCEKSWG